MTSGTDETVAATQPRVEGEGSERGDAVGRYLILDLLGVGGMGVVYAAYDPDLDRKVAVKLLHGPDPSRAEANVMHALFGDDPPTGEGAGQGRLLREAQAAARVNHPNVVTVHDVGEHNGRVFIAMEYVDGITLGAWLEAESRTWTEVVDVMTQAGVGLSAVHASNLVHRDFKPENVMLGADGRTRVMDFGLVRSNIAALETTAEQPKRNALGISLTQDGAVMGTPAYMSPEQYSGDPVEQASDQFSFCVVLWEALYGKRPFGADSLEALAVAVTSGDRTAAPADANVPVHIRRVLDRGLQTDPAQRFPSMDALLADLRRNPTRRRRWIFGLVGAAAGVAALAGFDALERRDRAAQCNAVAESVYDVWGPDAQMALRETMEASQLPFLSTGFDSVRPWLDEYATDWSQARKSACNAGKAEQLVCLDEAKVEFRAAIAMLSTGDGDVLRNAVTYASQLEPVSACSDPKHLEGRASLPDDPVEAREVKRLRRRLREAATLQSAGLTDEAFAALEGATEEAVALGQPLLAGKIEYIVGATHEAAGDYDAAEDVLSATALSLARAGADAHASDAAIRLALVIAQRQSRPAEGLVWGRWAEALLDRAGQTENLRGADLHNELGLIAESLGQYDEARSRYERNLELKESLLGRQHPSVGIALNNLGSVHSKLGHNEEAIRLYERARAVSEAALGPDHPDTALPLNNIAKIHWRRGNMDDARAAMERSLQIQEAALGKQHPQVGVSVGNLGIVLRDAGDLDAALAAHERAVEILRKRLPAKHPALAMAIKNLGDTQRSRGDHESARRNHAEALVLLEEALGPEHVEVASALASTAMDHREAREYEQATAILLRARSIYEASVGDEHPDLGVVLLELGRLALEDGRPADAAPSLRRAEEILSENPKLRAEASTLLGQATK